MAQILNIKLKNENFAIVEFDSGTGLVVPKLLVYELGLRKGDILGEEALDLLSRENELFTCEQKALGYLARRLHSKMELRRKLYQKKFTKPVIESIIDKLSAIKYIDDRKFAELVINESMNLRHDGMQKTKARLMEKGVDKKIIEEVLAETKDSDTEMENIKLTGDKKLFSLKKRFTDKRQVDQKLTAYLVGKGFSFEIIKEYLKSAGTDPGDFEE
jgi:regulatory protein